MNHFRRFQDKSFASYPTSSYSSASLIFTKALVRVVALPSDPTGYIRRAVMSGGGNDRFNAEAAAWDSNPDVHKASDAAQKAIIEAFPELQSHDAKDGQHEKAGLDVLEIGCGTGLLSFRIAPFVQRLVAVDASTGMIDALSKKLEADEAYKNVLPLCVMLEDPEDKNLPPAAQADVSGPRQKFDLILSHLVLHHIADLPSLLNTMYGCLKGGGSIALTDFEDFGPEARKFHPEAKMAGVERHGIPRKEFSQMITQAGFVDVQVDEGWRMRKHVEAYPGEWGQKKPSADDVKLEEMDFPFLLCRASKPRP
ncbi:MAG: hypothetical protein M1828_000900 [Chrysothrix sp. TS-e1954]|nr:MAG: hypothetical protein M1828_000900 [Chrysothrix sp. TS-e1954]